MSSTHAAGVPLCDLHPQYAQFAEQLHAAVTRVLASGQVILGPEVSAPEADVAERHGLVVIEDAAQAMGAEYQNKRAGSLGAIGCLSFYPTKNLGAYGDAGMSVTSDPQLAARMTCLRGHGMEPRYFHKYLGW